MNHDTQVDQRESDDRGIEDDRREFLRKCGRFAAYTAPVVVTLMAGSKAQSGAAPISAG
jgi:hypothetical protein